MMITSFTLQGIYIRLFKIQAKEMAMLFPVTLKRALKNLTFAFLHFVAQLSTTAFRCVLPNATGTQSQPAGLSAILWS